MLEEENWKFEMDGSFGSVPVRITWIGRI